MARKTFISVDINQDEDVILIGRKEPMKALLWKDFILLFDDWGRANASAVKIKSTMFPSFDFVSEPFIEELIETYSDAGLLTTYTVGGKPYMFIDPIKWYAYQPHINKSNRQHPEKSKFPAPPGQVWPFPPSGGKEPNTEEQQGQTEMNLSRDNCDHRDLSRDIATSRNSTPVIAENRASLTLTLSDSSSVSDSATLTASGSDPGSVAAPRARDAGPDQRTTPDFYNADPVAAEAYAVCLTEGITEHETQQLLTSPDIGPAVVVRQHEFLPFRNPRTNRRALFAKSCWENLPPPPDWQADVEAKARTKAEHAAARQRIERAEFERIATEAQRQRNAELLAALSDTQLSRLRDEAVTHLRATIPVVMNRHASSAVTQRLITDEMIRIAAARDGPQLSTVAA